MAHAPVARAAGERALRTAAMQAAVVLLVASACAAAEAASAGAAAPVPQATIGRVEFGAQSPRNIQGSLLVLDAGSLTYRGNHPMAPGTPSADACAAACAALPGCDSWNWCGRRGGCGVGCKAHVKAHPPLPSNMSTPGGISTKDKKLPLMGYGPWPQPYGSDGCQYNPSGGSYLATTDAWSYGTCSLKRQKDTANPVYAQGPDDGWVSATVSVPPVCGGLSAVACGACLSSKHPLECLACAKDARATAHPAVDFLGSGKGVEMQQGCGLCANLTNPANRQKCVKCVLGQQPCAFCVSNAEAYGTGPPNIAACLDCVAARGAQYRGGCSACAQSGAGAARCFQCLAAFPLSFCADGEAPGPGATCMSTTYKTPCDICNAAKSQEAYDKCTACFKKTGGASGECQSCTWLDGLDAQAQGRCFDCVVKAGVTGPNDLGCSPCFYQWVGPARDKCLACAESKATPLEAKRTCAYCVGSGAAADKAQRCVACLQAPQAAGFDYSNTCKAS